MNWDFSVASRGRRVGFGLLSRHDAEGNLGLMRQAAGQRGNKEAEL